MSVWDTLELLPLSMVLLSVPPVKMPAAIRTPNIQKHELKHRLCLFLCDLKPVKFVVIELTIKSNTNCHLFFSSTLRSHTHAYCPALPPPHSANWFSFLSLRVRNSWLARPSRPPRPSRTEKAAWTNSGSACVQRAGGAGGGEGGGGGGSDWQKWGKRGWISENKLPHLASLCLKRQKLQLGRFGWRLYSYRRVLYSVIPHVLLVCLTYLWLELWMLLLPFLILVVNAGIQRRWITVDVFSRLFRTKLLELN